MRRPRQKCDGPGKMRSESGGRKNETASARSESRADPADQASRAATISQHAGTGGSRRREPAYTKTQFDANFLAPDSKLDEYREVRALLDKVFKEVMATADEPTVVADVVLEAAIADRPKLRYAAGGLANRLRLLRRFAPAGLVDAGIRKDLRLDAPTVSLPGNPVLGGNLISISGPPDPEFARHLGLSRILERTGSRAPDGSYRRGSHSAWSTAGLTCCRRRSSQLPRRRDERRSVSDESRAVALL
jgi:hypothetical protein